MIEFYVFEFSSRESRLFFFTLYARSLPQFVVRLILLAYLWNSYFHKKFRIFTWYQRKIAQINYLPLRCARLFCRYNFKMDSKVSIPLLTPFTSYLDWKLNLIASLKRQGIY